QRRRDGQRFARWPRRLAHARLRVPRPRRSALKNLPVERLRLFLGIGPELALEGAHAELIPPQGGAAPPEVTVEAHQCPVPAFLRPVEGQYPQPSLDRRLERSRLALLDQEPRERVLGQLAQPQALGDEPRLECGLLERQPFEKLALIEVGGP